MGKLCNKLVHILHCLFVKETSKESHSPEADVSEETERCWSFILLQNQLDCQRLKRKGRMKDKAEHLETLCLELDCLGQLYQLAVDLDIFTFQFLINNVIEDGFKTANQALKLLSTQQGANKRDHPSETELKEIRAHQGPSQATHKAQSKEFCLARLHWFAREGVRFVMEPLH